MEAVGQKRVRTGYRFTHTSFPGSLIRKKKRDNKQESLSAPCDSPDPDCTHWFSLWKVGEGQHGIRRAQLTVLEEINGGRACAKIGWMAESRAVTPPRRIIIFFYPQARMRQSHFYLFPLCSDEIKATQPTTHKAFPKGLGGLRWSYPSNSTSCRPALLLPPTH